MYRPACTGSCCQSAYIKPSMNPFTLTTSVCDTNFIVRPDNAIAMNNNSIK